MQKTFLNLLDRIPMIFNTIWGWVAALALSTVEYFAGHSFVIFLVVAVTVMDAVWGIILANKRGEFTLSELARQTVAKLAVYGCALFVFVGLDKFTGSTISSSVIGAIIVLVEFWSTCAIMLILFPYIPILNLLKKALTGEIAAKLHIPEDDVESVLRAGIDSIKKNKQ